MSTNLCPRNCGLRNAAIFSRSNFVARVKRAIGVCAVGENLTRRTPTASIVWMKFTDKFTERKENDTHC